MASIPNGYHGQYLRIDLSLRQFEAVPLPADVLRNYIGGSGLGTWILLQESQPNQNPLSAEAPLIFVFSPLVGSPLTTSAKFAVVAQSPLTGRINDSLSSSGFAISGKKTGYDAIVIVGAAEAPTSVVIDSLNTRFEDAAELWGLSSSQAEAKLSEKLGPKFKTAAIGLAGEKLVRFASVSHDGRHAGRGGLGAVMGSKKLKSISVAGEKQVQYAHPSELSKYAKQLSKDSFGPATEKYRELGTVGNLLTFNRLGALPVHNFQQTTFAEAESFSPEALAVSHEKTRASCAACTIGCEHIYQLKNDSPGNSKSVRMEYENLFALGPLCGITDSETVFQASALCDELGIDTISAGGTAAFAMECAEKGFIDAPELRFGNGQALLELLAEMVHQKTELGQLFCQGSRAAAHAIGHNSLEFAPQVKGLEIPGYEPRTLQTMALGFAVGTRGADHNRSGAYQVDFSEAGNRFELNSESIGPAIEIENEAAVMDSLILCKFLRGVFDDKLASMSEMLRLVTGWSVDAAELEQTARRIVTAKKWFNIQQGWTPEEDVLPQRFFSEPVVDGPGKGTLISESRLNELIQQYNLSRGWDKSGWIPNDLLHELDICESF